MATRLSNVYCIIDKVWRVVGSLKANSKGLVYASIGKSEDFFKAVSEADSGVLFLYMDKGSSKTKIERNISMFDGSDYIKVGELRFKNDVPYFRIVKNAAFYELVLGSNYPFTTIFLGKEIIKNDR